LFNETEFGRGSQLDDDNENDKTTEGSFSKKKKKNLNPKAKYKKTLAGPIMGSDNDLKEKLTENLSESEINRRD